jgi:cytidylate kinase
MTVLSISRQFGAGGWTLGKAVADRLNYHFVSVGVIEEMAKEANVSVEWIKSTEKNAGDWLLRLSSKLVSSSFIERHIGESRSDFDEDKYLIFLKTIIKKIANDDNVVILGRGSQFILQDDPNTIKVLIVADIEDRVAFLQKIWNVDEREAKKTIQTREKRREILLRHFNQGPANSPGLYHLVINTSKMGIEEAEDMIVWLVKRKYGKKE